jgi:predicted metal-binding protein
MTTAFICITCRGTGDDRPGAALLEAVEPRLRDAGIVVTAVECLSVCKRPCTIALAARGKWTYVIGDLDPLADVNNVVSMARSYDATTDGIVPWRERPAPIRKGTGARIPPVQDSAID